MQQCCAGAPCRPAPGGTDPADVSGRHRCPARSRGCSAARGFACLGLCRGHHRRPGAGLGVGDVPRPCRHAAHRADDAERHGALPDQRDPDRADGLARGARGVGAAARPARRHRRGGPARSRRGPLRLPCRAAGHPGRRRGLDDARDRPADGHSVQRVHPQPADDVQQRGQVVQRAAVPRDRPRDQPDGGGRGTRPRRPASEQPGLLPGLHALARDVPRLSGRVPDQERHDDSRTDRDQADFRPPDALGRGRARRRRRGGAVHPAGAGDDVPRHHQGGGLRRHVPVRRAPDRPEHARIPAADRTGRAGLRDAVTAQVLRAGRLRQHVRADHADPAAVGHLAGAGLRQPPRHADPEVDLRHRPGGLGQLLRPGSVGAAGGGPRPPRRHLQQDDLRAAPAARPADRGPRSHRPPPPLHRGGALGRVGGRHLHRHEGAHHRSQPLRRAAAARLA